MNPHEITNSVSCIDKWRHLLAAVSQLTAVALLLIQSAIINFCCKALRSNRMINRRCCWSAKAGQKDGDKCVQCANIPLLNVLGNQPL